MGLADNICTDKTGTITENLLLVEEIWNQNLVICINCNLIILLFLKYSMQFSQDLWNQRTNFQETLFQGLACNNSAFLVLVFF